MYLQRLTLQDLPTVQRLGRATYEPYYPHVWYDGGMEWYLELCFGDTTLRRELADPTIEFYVPISDDNKEVGLIKVHPNHPIYDGSCDNAFFIEKIYLMPEFFGQGIGQILLEILTRRAAALGREAIWLNVMHNAGPVGAYAKAGFKITGPINFNYDYLKEEERDGWVMVKPLEAAPTPLVEIIPFESRYKSDFKRLNIAWISHYFVVEPHDEEQLDQPERFIIEPGGTILLARIEDQIVGTVAMVPEGDQQYELAKMAVDDTFKGYQIGKKLGQAALDWARAQGANHVFLLSNRRLTPALNLYRRLGFVETPLGTTEYNRADIRMDVDLLPEPQIVRVAPSQVKELVALARQTFIDAFAHLNDPADFDAYVNNSFTEAKFAEELARPDSAFYFVYAPNIHDVEMSDSAPIGYYKINYNTTPLDSEGAVLDIDMTPYEGIPMAELQRIYLHKDWHGKGIAQPMMAHAEQAARASGAQFFWLGVWDANAQSRRYYAKCGFEPIGYHTFQLGNESQIDILLWKRL
jgi:putative acetyltransferase